MKDDLYVNAPAVPAANTSVVWIDTSDGTFKEYEGLVGDVVFNQAVTIYVETAPEPASGEPVFRVMNNAGAGDVVAANTPTEVHVAFLGPNTRIRIAVGGVVPTVWHVNGRLTKEGLQPVASTGAVRWGVTPMVAGPAGAAGATGATGATGAAGAAGAAGSGGDAAAYEHFEGAVSPSTMTPTGHADISAALADNPIYILPNGTAADETKTVRNAPGGNGDLSATYREIYVQCQFISAGVASATLINPDSKPQIMLPLRGACRLKWRNAVSRWVILDMHGNETDHTFLDFGGESG